MTIKELLIDPVYRDATGALVDPACQAYCNAHSRYIAETGEEETMPIDWQVLQSDWE